MAEPGFDEKASILPYLEQATSGPVERLKRPEFRPKKVRGGFIHQLILPTCAFGLFLWFFGMFVFI
jgi:hypothetical protein